MSNELENQAIQIDEKYFMEKLYGKIVHLPNKGAIVHEGLLAKERFYRDAIPEMENLSQYVCCPHCQQEVNKDVMRANVKKFRERLNKIERLIHFCKICRKMIQSSAKMNDEASEIRAKIEKYHKEYFKLHDDLEWEW